MTRFLDRTSRTQHWLVAAFSIWLIATSPWVSMRRIVPQKPTFWDYGHIGLGIALAVLAITYLVTITIEGRWRQYLPWLAGDFSGIGKDFAGIVRGRIPPTGGAGLLSTTQGLLLLLLLATALTGVGWLVTDGGRAALAWREGHIIASNVFAWFLVLHVMGSALHLADFLRE